MHHYVKQLCTAAVDMIGQSRTEVVVHCKSYVVESLIIWMAIWSYYTIKDKLYLLLLYLHAQ